MVKKAFSQESNEKKAVADLKKSLEGIDPTFVVYFCSSLYQHESLAKEMKTAFKDATVIGCTTAGELISGKMLKDSIVVMAFDKDTVESAYCEVIEDVKSSDLNKKIRDFVSNFEKQISSPVDSLNEEEYVGMILVDGLCGMEEDIMTVLSYVIEIPFIGGSAGDDRNYKLTHVFLDGKSYTNATVLALLKVTKGYSVLKTQSFKDTGEFLVATKVDVKNRKVLEFNGKPAVEAYAEKIGTTPDRVDRFFRRNTLGLHIDDNVFVRSPQQVEGESIIFYCRIEQGQKLRLLESEDIVKKTKEDLDKKIAELESVSSIINFNCILRTQELEAKNQAQEYAKLFTSVPMIGFSTYGEQYIGHMNQTSTMLFFK